MRFGVVASVLFHGCVVGLAFLSLPEGWQPDVTPEPFVPISILSEAELSELTSVPAARPEPEPVEEQVPDLPAEEVIEEPLPEPEAQEPVPLPEPEPIPEPEPEPEPTPELEPEPEPVKPEPVKPPEPKNDDLDLDALSRVIDKAKETEKAPSGAPSEVAETADEARRQVGAGDRLTASEASKMRAAVSRCWNASAIIGAPEPEKLKVQVEFELNRDGTLSGQPRVANAGQINFSGNRFWKVAEQNAVRAVVACQPYDFLSQDRYATWKEFELNFDPSQMAGF